MIDNIRFEHFRGFKSLELRDIKPLTLISGKNNAGKTSVLEGIFLGLAGMETESFIKINQIRGIYSPDTPTDIWETLFYNMDTTVPAQITMRLNGSDLSLNYSRDDSFRPLRSGWPVKTRQKIISSAKSSYALKILYKYKDIDEVSHFVLNEDGPEMFTEKTQTMNFEKDSSFTESLPEAHFINSLIVNTESDRISEWLGLAELNGDKGKVIDILKNIEPSISELSVILRNNSVQIYAKAGESLLPLKLSGDGINRLAFIVLAIMTNPNSIILVDEIETGFHYSMYPMLWNVVAQAAREQNCQIIATTHSYECIMGAAEGIEAAGMKDDFCYCRIDRKKNSDTSAGHFDFEMLNAAGSANWEVR